MAEINVSPGHGIAGRHPTREFVDTLSGHDDPGMFGRMFPTLPKFRPEDSKLDALAETMRDVSVAPTSANGELKIDPGDNKNVPSGFTYLGQFIDHDVTLDLTSLAEKQEDPNATRNFRTPRLDLDAIYGLGPDGSPQLYARKGSKAGASPGPKFLIGKNMELPDPAGAFRNDLPRSPEGFALIGDHRNDENLIVAQTHLAFLKFHNKVVDMLAGGATPSNALFAEARRIVTWHYQWMVLHDFVERLTEDGIIDSILKKGRQFYRFQTTPYMPIEFSAAAYRLGHSMVRERYSHNRIFDNTGFNLLFKFTGLSGDVQGEDGQFKTVPSNWIIDWRRWYDFKTPPGDFPPPSSGGTKFVFNFSRRIDPFIAPMLHTLPGGGGNLAARNLKRGARLGLPCGQDVAKAMRIRNPLTPDEIATGPDGKVAEQQGLHQKTPLWYYILKEAQVRKNGQRLGPVGSTMVAEVFLGLVHGDHDSFLWMRKNWKPELPAKKPGTFTMTDLLQFVGDVSPIDGVKTVSTL